MRQQEDFRTPADASDAPTTPIFDERSARRAAPVVPLEKVAPRRRFANWPAANWRETVNTPQFRRSWPLALLLVATLAAAVAATNIYTDDAAATPTAAAATETNGDEAQAASTEQTANAGQTSSRDRIDNSRDARRVSEADAAPDEKSVANPEAFTAAALGGIIGNAANDADGERSDAVASGRDERGERDRGKRHKRSKHRRGSRHGGGAILFDVIR